MARCSCCTTSSASTRGTSRSSSSGSPTCAPRRSGACGATPRRSARGGTRMRSSTPTRCRPRSSRSTRATWRRRRWSAATLPGTGSSPGQLDLQLALVRFDLELDLHVDLVGDVDLHVHPAALELDVVVSSEGVGEPAQPLRGLFARHRLLLLDLQDVHQPSLVVVGRPAAMLASSRRPPQTVSGTAADGDAPG